MENTNYPSKPIRDPFFAGNFGVHSVYTDSHSRKECVRRFTEQQCLDALELPDLQPSVRKVIEQRLRYIAKHEKRQL